MKNLPRETRPELAAFPQGATEKRKQDRCTNPTLPALMLLTISGPPLASESTYTRDLPLPMRGCLSLTRSGIALQLAQIPGIMQQTHCCIFPKCPATSSESIRPSHKRISATITADIFPVGHQELVF